MRGLEKDRMKRDILTDRLCDSMIESAQWADSMKMKKCGKSCPAYPYVKEGKEIQNNQTKWVINSSVNFESFNIIYLLECNKSTC